jgi:hypothetical protein
VTPTRARWLMRNTHNPSMREAMWALLREQADRRATVRAGGDLRPVDHGRHVHGGWRPSMWQGREQCGGCQVLRETGTAA